MKKFTETLKPGRKREAYARAFLKGAERLESLLLADDNVDITSRAMVRRHANLIRREADLGYHDGEGREL